LSGANLEGANLFGAHLEGADLRGAIFDDATRVDWDWDDMTQDERQAAQDKLRDLGARHVDDPDEDEDEDEGDDVPF
ncbi:MAG: pentapeptide repeat-containing protein, partial [Sphingopyxis sp.]